jgi:hypothetical protein
MLRTPTRDRTGPTPAARHKEGPVISSSPLSTHGDSPGLLPERFAERCDRGFTTAPRWYSIRCMDQQRARVHREDLEGLWRFCPGRERGFPR